MIKYTVDRIEENYAVCFDEKDKLHNFELSKIGFEVKEGMFIQYDNDKDCFYPDKKNTDRLKEENRNRLTDLFKRNNNTTSPKKQ